MQTLSKKPSQQSKALSANRKKTSSGKKSTSGKDAAKKKKSASAPLTSDKAQLKHKTSSSKKSTPSSAKKKSSLSGNSKKKSSSAKKKSFGKSKASSSRKTAQSKKNKSLFSFDFLGKPSKAKKNAGKVEKPERDIKNTTQDLIPLKAVTNGMICLLDGRYIKILEVEPTNYYQKPVEEQNSIISMFTGVFRNAPVKLQFKTITRRVDASKITNRILKQNSNTPYVNIRVAANDYINQINLLAEKISAEKKYYIIFEYEGDSSGNRSTKIDEITSAMEITALDLRRRIESCGNRVVVHEDENMFLLQTLYEFYNLKSSATESLSDRIARIDNDRKICAEKSGKPLPRPDLADYVAPRGIDFAHNKDFFMMDGTYYTYVALSDDGFPGSVEAGWLDILFNQYDIGVDIDFYTKKLPRDTTRYSIEKASSLRRVSAAEHQGNVSKFQTLITEASNGDYIAQKLRAGEDIFQCCLIATIWDEDPGHLIQIREMMKKDLTSNDLQIEDSHYDCASYFKMTAPLLDFQQDIMSRTEHNFLTSSLPSIYNFTAFQMFDQGGIVLGQNLQTGSVVAVDPFNTGIYKNANIIIAGTTGSGKTFTELTIGRRAFLSGRGTYYILPVKGEEYRSGINSVNGEYIVLQPGSSACVNIMEIRPENIFRGDDDGDNEIKEEQTRSLLAKKIQSLMVFISLLQAPGDKPLDSDEKNQMNALLMQVYGQFGITDDNRSIFEEDGKTLKLMPTISMVYYALMDEPGLKRIASLLLPFVSGSCKNMDQQTNVNLNNRCIAFDVNEDNVGADLLPAFMYIATDCVYDLVKADKDNFDMVFLDEVWKMMVNKACAEQVKHLVKLIRGYGGGVIMATQDLYDFTNDPGGFGIAVLNNTKIKLILQLESDELKRTGELLNLTPAEKRDIAQFRRGSCLLVSNNVRVKLHILPTQLEIEAFTTDLNVKKAIKERQKESS